MLSEQLDQAHDTEQVAGVAGILSNDQVEHPVLESAVAGEVKNGRVAAPTVAEKLVYGVGDRADRAWGRAALVVLGTAEMKAALQYLKTGRPTYRSAYRLRQKSGHPNLAGLMTWSINWDASRDGGKAPYSFAREATRAWSEIP